MTGMDDLIHALEAEHKREIPEFRPGDIIRCYERVSEGARERLQPFEGVVLKISGSGTRTMVTVRKVAAGVGVERTVPVYSPKLERIEVVKRHGIRKGRPYWLRRVARIHKIG
ncbi:MAG: 50S ribosomal protein L19 [Candidatus Acetothermia bacterium]|jgi:large subunit ribosomal protein L19|nr:50S ribosomal protein L19 [Candidatus Acetothermia bacterium]